MSNWKPTKAENPDYKCRKCKSDNVWYRNVESSDGAHDDIHYICRDCQHEWWLESADYLGKNNKIPDMVNELRKHWEQPSAYDIEIDDSHAMMSTATRLKLKRYDTTLPSGVYVGKMWCRSNVGIRYLMWFGASKKPSECTVNIREIIEVN